VTTSEVRFLSRAEAAEFLSQRGYKTAPATLAKRAVVGGGPPFVSWGRKPLYQPEALLEWAQRRCTAPRRSTSDRGEARQRADRLGDPEVADSGDLEWPVEEISAGISARHQMPGHPPAPPCIRSRPTSTPRPTRRATKTPKNHVRAKAIREQVKASARAGADDRTMAYGAGPTDHADKKRAAADCDEFKPRGNDD